MTRDQDAPRANKRPRHAPPSSSLPLDHSSSSGGASLAAGKLARAPRPAGLATAREQQEPRQQQEGRESKGAALPLALAMEPPLQAQAAQQRQQQQPEPGHMLRGLESRAGGGQQRRGQDLTAAVMRPEAN
eukprot:CAMPEP_0117657542 /NCGR_PEP_ID=MMETSP0804-20121206/5387_1 /TAXON_ID=1074897 /ORGANISM="Tetraselmis astigmatica, Strain CCMP880" /LENGTH=130 /DNA_ID=CAMNT_0005464005 /DNA_START=30 /DNA_END=423 /DNA_ORIENTATION=-